MYDSPEKFDGFASSQPKFNLGDRSYGYRNRSLFYYGQGISTEIGLAV